MSVSLQKVEAGAWPDWAIAVLALAALLVSVTTLAQQSSDRRRHDAARVDANMGTPAHVLVTNGAARPVFDVRVRLTVSGAPWPLETSKCWRVGPNAAEEFALSQPLLDAHTLGPQLLAIDVSFRDAAGRRWRRSPDGRLRRGWWWRRA